MNVLFISETHFTETPFRDESTRYRCYHMAEGLHAAGFLADVTTLEALNLVSLSRYDVVSVQQPTASRKLLSLLERCQQLNIRTVADLDALEFDPTLAKDSPKSRLKNNSLAQVRASFMRQSLALQHFDEVCVATTELARARRAIAPSQLVFVAPNGLSNFWLAGNDFINTASSSQKRIGFFADSRGRSAEFATAASALKTYLQASPDHELYIVGPLTIPDNQLPEAQTVRGAWVDFMDTPRVLSTCQVQISPHLPNSMNYAQPHTKFIEAAAFGIPTISSPTADLERHDVPGLFLAKNHAQWLEGLALFSDETYLQACQKTLYEYARDCCLATMSAQTLIRQWSAKHENHKNETVTRLSAAS